ncbi:zinc-dependent alcohol dehydrogenase family protein [Massilia atriviolacea]|uniref:Zinc-binding alcohol dehydrogenase family protein n=1 Tax=Massilia atriviolacea TaxID=2495579 RepID=A0A430HUA1_9BURK|nr:zinc-binding alcohol dehydrogenase family protein [Massilia atriviolacea]
MDAMVMRAAEDGLRLEQVAVPRPGEHDVLLQVSACGVCRTDLHILDGDLAPHRHALVPGHEIVGRVVDAGRRARRFEPGQRVGVPWLGSTCGRCGYCLSGRENLCGRARFTGYDRDGGYAQYAAADERYCFALPERYDDLHAAPLLCAGLIGYRALAMSAPAGPLGLYGFGAAAHLVAQLAAQGGRTVFAFTRPGDVRSQQFARSLGVSWAGASGDKPPELLGAAILFAPVGALVPQALAASAKGASIVCAGIHMSDIPAMSYALLWGERCLRSVANLTRQDGERFFRLAADHALRIVPVAFPLGAATEALGRLRSGSIDGAAVLAPWAPPVAAGAASSPSARMP